MEPSPGWAAVVVKVRLLGPIRIAWRPGATLELLEAPEGARALLSGAPSAVLIEAAGHPSAVAWRAVLARRRRGFLAEELPVRAGRCASCDAPPEHGDPRCAPCRSAQRLAGAEELPSVEECAVPPAPPAPPPASPRAPSRPPGLPPRFARLAAGAPRRGWIDGE